MKSAKINDPHCELNSDNDNNYLKHAFLNFYIFEFQLIFFIATDMLLATRVSSVLRLGF